MMEQAGPGLGILAQQNLQMFFIAFMKLFTALSIEAGYCSSAYCGIRRRQLTIQTLLL